jgi:chromosomal replication initiation ATPase DnaA
MADVDNIRKNSSDLLEIRDFVKRSMNSILLKIDNELKKDGGVIMFEGMTINEKIDFVIDEVCNYGGVTKNELLGAKKQLRITKWVKIVCYILQDKLHIAVSDIRHKLNYDSNQNVQFHTDTMRGFIKLKDQNNDMLVALNEILKHLKL